jgi:hypothetical protein
LPSAKYEVLRTHKAAMTLCAVSFATIAGESYLFDARALSPSRGLVIQATKSVVVGAQWVVMVIHDKAGQEKSREVWMVILGEAVLFTALR